MNLSLYGEYIQEREGKSIIENDFGFATFLINGDECYVCDIYIKKEHRIKNIASKFTDEIADIGREMGCKYLLGTVTPSLRGATVSMKAQLAYGFKIHAAKDDFIFLRKEL